MTGGHYAVSRRAKEVRLPTLVEGIWPFQFLNTSLQALLSGFRRQVSFVGRHLMYSGLSPNIFTGVSWEQE